MTFNGMQQTGRNLTIEELNAISRSIGDNFNGANNKMRQLLLTEFNALKSEGLIKTPDDFVKILRETGRDKKILTISKQIMQNTLKSANAHAVNGSLIAINNNYYRQQFSMAWFTPVGKSSQLLDFDFIDPVAVEMSVFGTNERWKLIKDLDRKKDLDAYNINGQRPDLKSVLRANEKKTIQRIQQSITNGYIQGYGVNKIVSEIRKAVNMSARSLRRIVRTETHRNLNAGQYASYIDAKNQGVGTNRVVHAVYDGRPRQQSATVDGRKDIYENNTFAYPDGYRVQIVGNSGNPAWDINDREYTTTELEGVPNSKRIGVDPLTGEWQEAEYNNFGEWAKANKLKFNKSGRLVSEKGLVFNKKGLLEPKKIKIPKTKINTTPIDKIPTFEKFNGSLTTMYNNAPPKIKKAIDNGNKPFGVLRKEAGKGDAYYRPSTNNIYIRNYRDKAEMSNTLAHEYGHAIFEHLPIEQKVIIEKSFDLEKSKIADKVLKGTISKEKVLEIVKADGRGYGGQAFSDLIGGMSNNRLHGNYLHGNDYWYKKSNKSHETFAHFFSLTATNNKKGLKILRQQFPAMSRAFNKIIRELGNVK